MAATAASVASRDSRKRLVQAELPGVEQELADDGVAEIAVRLLDERQVEVLRFLAQVCELVLAAAAALELPGMREQQPRLPEQVERHVGEPEVLLERRRVPDPFAEPLREHEVRVGEPQDVAPVRRHSVFTSSGMS